MLGVNQSDFMSYMSALKTNYRKGIHRMEAILANPTHASEFAANLGGVSVVLGVPVGLPDRNSDKLLELLLGSTVADDAVETWLHQFYEFTGWDDLLSDSARCKEMANNPLIWRAAGGSKLAVGKSVATLAGLSCSDYKDIDAVAASSVAMAAIIGNSTALNAVVTSQVAMAAVIGNATALNAVVTSSVAMTAVAASQVAMTAVASSNTATKAIAASQTALNAIAGSTTALDVLYAKKSRLTGASASKSGKFIILQISNDSVFNTSKYGYATLSDGSQPSWESYKGKYAFFMQYKKIATYIKNDTEGDDWIDYFPCG